ncbi:DAN protein, partial [Pseudoatta argentina]
MVPARCESNLNVSDPGLSMGSSREKLNANMRVHNGESKAAVARDIGVSESTLRGWCKTEDKIMSQINNIKASTIPLSGIDLATYFDILIFRSDNNNNNGVGKSSSRSTIEATMLGLSSTSGATRRAEEFETGPFHKKIKFEDSSAGSTTTNNISILAGTPGLIVPQSKTSRNNKSLTSIKDSSLHHPHVPPPNSVKVTFDAVNNNNNNIDNETATKNYPDILPLGCAMKWNIASNY